jgi:hypothetical protein
MPSANAFGQCRRSMAAYARRQKLAPLAMLPLALYCSYCTRICCCRSLYLL